MSHAHKPTRRTYKTYATEYPNSSHPSYIIILTVANAKITSRLPQTFLVSSAPLFFVLEDVAAVPVAVLEVVAFFGSTTAA